MSEFLSREEIKIEENSVRSVITPKRHSDSILLEEYLVETKPQFDPHTAMLWINHVTITEIANTHTLYTHLCQMHSLNKYVSRKYVSRKIDIYIQLLHNALPSNNGKKSAFLDEIRILSDKQEKTLSNIEKSIPDSFPPILTPTLLPIKYPPVYQLHPNFITPIAISSNDMRPEEFEKLKNTFFCKATALNKYLVQKK